MKTAQQRLSLFLACSVMAVMPLLPVQGAIAAGVTPGCNLMNFNSAKNIDIIGGSSAAGAGVVQWTPSSSDSQRFLLQPFGPTLVLIQNVHSGKVLDVAGASTAEGAGVIQWDWNGGTNQLWTPLGTVGLDVFVNLRSGKVLDVSGGSLTTGAPLVQWSYNGGYNQYFGVFCPTPPVTTTTSTTTPTTTSTSTTTTRPSTTTTTAAPVDQVGALCRLINDYRAQNGLNPLLLAAPLTNDAQWLSADMAQKNYLSHTDSLGRDTFQRMTAFGYGYSTTKGENIAAGTSTAAATLANWKSDPLHNAAILNSSFVVMGIGRAYQATSQFGWYWSTPFGGYNSGGTACPAA